MYILSNEWPEMACTGYSGIQISRDLCKIWQVLDSHRQGRVKFRFSKELQIMGGNNIHVASSL
jgi:hypothetical protein